MLTRKDFWDICPQLANKERGFKGAVEVVAGLSRSCTCYPLRMKFEKTVSSYVCTNKNLNKMRLF